MTTHPLRSIVLFFLLVAPLAVSPAEETPAPPTTAAVDEMSVPPGVTDGGGDETEPFIALERLAAARGGVGLLDRLTQVRRKGILTVLNATGEQEMPISVFVQPPDQVRLETGAGDQIQIRVLDSTLAYQTVGRGAPVDLDVPGRDSLRRLALVDEAFLAGHARRGLLRVKGTEPAGDGQLPAEHESRGGTAIIIGVPTGSDVRLVVPVGGGLPVRMDYEMSDGRGGTRPASEVYRTWRVIEGIPFPFEIVLYVEGRAVTLLHYDTIEVSIDPPPAGS